MVPAKKKKFIFEKWLYFSILLSIIKLNDKISVFLFYISNKKT